MLVYTGNGAINEGYSQFAAAAGRDAGHLVDAAVDRRAVGLATRACVLPVPTVGFTDRAADGAQQLRRPRGGTVVALAEHLNADQSQTVGPASVTTLNNLASGTGIQALNTSREPGSDDGHTRRDPASRVHAGRQPRRDTPRRRR